MVLNIFHIICRGIVLALLASYLHYLSLAFIGAMVIGNYIISNIIIKTDGSKHFWTAFASVLLPNAFISRDTVSIVGRQKTRELFQTFYKANSVLFLILIGIGALITTNCLITLTDFIQYNCNNLPFLSYDKVNYLLDSENSKSDIFFIFFRTVPLPAHSINHFHHFFLFLTVGSSS